MYKLLFFVLVSVNFSFAQVTKVEYEFYKNMGIPSTENWMLAFNESASYFYRTKDKQRSTNSNENKSALSVEDLYQTNRQNKLNEGTVIKHTIQLKAHYFYHLDFNQNLLRFQGSVVEDLYMVNEELPKMNWILQDEYKDIEKYKCQKAITNFRGRNYSAWFTYEIPVTTGPWKFNGLPGLILQVNDDLGKVNIRAQLVTTYPTLNLPEEVSFIKPQGKDITLREFVPLSDNEAEELIRRVRTKLGRSSGGSTFKKASERHSLEKTYEWEEDK